MSTRLATEKDIALLEGMLARMGQLWSEAAIKEATAEPWITVIHETDGKPDGFYMDLDMVGQSILGPGDASHESHGAWLRAICEMGLAINVEFTRRNPKVDQTKWWVLTRIWPDKMGPLNTFIETSFDWKAQVNPGPGSGKDGYKEFGSGKEYWQRLSNIVAQAKAVLAALEKTA